MLPGFLVPIERAQLTRNAPRDLLCQILNGGPVVEDTQLLEGWCSEPCGECAACSLGPNGRSPLCHNPGHPGRVKNKERKR